MNPDVKLKTCILCLGSFPLANFSFQKYSKDFHGTYCKSCKAQKLRLFRRANFVVRPNPNVSDHIIRNVRDHNKTIVIEALKHNEYTCLAYQPSTNTQFKVYFGRSKETGFKCVSIFNLDGVLFREFAYSGKDEDIHETILEIIWNLKIRLELSDLTLLEAKQVIYYL